MLGENHGLDAAADYINMMVEEMERVCNISGHVGKDDVGITRRVMRDGTIREIKKKLGGNNIKELVRKMRFSMPLTKLLSADSNVREYLLYCALHVQAMLGKIIYLPAEVLHKELTSEEWSALGDRLAGTQAAKYSISPDDLPWA